jgi:hypothetical protein
MEGMTFDTPKGKMTFRSGRPPGDAIDVPLPHQEGREDQRTFELVATMPGAAVPVRIKAEEMTIPVRGQQAL